MQIKKLLLRVSVIVASLCSSKSWNELHGVQKYYNPMQKYQPATTTIWITWWKLVYTWLRPQALCIYDQSLTTKCNTKKQNYKTPNNELVKFSNIKIITPKCTLSVIRSLMNMLHITINITNEYSIKLSHLS